MIKPVFTEEEFQSVKLYVVGGFVRDKILGIESKDIDFTFVLPDKFMEESASFGFTFMESYMRSLGYEIFLMTPEAFTIRAKFPKTHKNAGTVADFVMARKEIGYFEGTRMPILKLGSLKDDLIRRDFTLNALCEDEDGNLIDLFNGVEDLNNKILRTPLDPKVTMMDDPLRILRAFRLSITKGFSIHQDIILAVKNNKEFITKFKTVISKERIREELQKMFKYDTIKSLILLENISKEIPELYEILFIDNMWLKPTFEN